MRVLTRGALLLAICVAAPPAKSDEIQLKDGKTFYGVIVAYDNNMFKVKTDFGYILVEKSKIAAILPNGSEAAKNDAKGNAKPGADAPGTPARKQGEAERSQPSSTTSKGRCGATQRRARGHVSHRDARTPNIERGGTACDTRERAEDKRHSAVDQSRTFRSRRGFGDVQHFARSAQGSRDPSDS